MATRSMTENEFQYEVEKLARRYGWKSYHAPRSWGPRTKGFPDLILVRDRVLFRELKSENGDLSQSQEECIKLLRKAGSDAKVWRPSEIKKIRAELSEEMLEEEDLFEDERIKLEEEREEIEKIKEYLVHVAEEKGIDIRHAILHLD